MEKRTFSFILATIFCLFLLTSLGAEEEQGTEVKANEVAPEQTVDILDIPLESLLDIKVTTATKSQEQISDAPGIMSVITRDEIKRFGGTTFKDVLERVAGLVGTTSYFTDRSMIASRGDQIKSTSGHTLFLIDGRPTREIQEGGISSDLLESFPVNIIDRIEVVKGPGSVLYGSDAVSLVVNIITQKPETEKDNNVSVRGLGEIEGGFNSSGEMLLKQKDLSLVLSFKAFNKDKWHVIHSAPDLLSGDVATDTVDIPNRGYGAFASMNYKNFNLMTSLTTWNTENFALQGPCTNDWGRTFADMGYYLKINDKFDMNFNTSYTRTSLESSANPDIRRRGHNLVAEWTNKLKPIERLSIIAGGTYELSSAKERTLRGDTLGFYSTVSDETRSSFAFYTQEDYWLIMKTLKVVGGLQLNKVENISLKLLPRGGVVWYPFPKFNVKTLYSRAFRAPSINEIGLTHPQLNGNPDLSPETVDTVDFGVGYFGESVQGGVSYFYNKHKNIIISDFSGGFPGQYINSGELTIQGVEAESKYYLTRQIFLTGSFMYQRSEDETGATGTVPFPPILFKAGASYDNDKYGITFSLFNLFQSELSDKFDNPDFGPLPKSYDRLNLYSKVNFNKLFNLDWKYGVSYLMQIDNLLNTQVYLPDWGGFGTVPIPYIKGIAAYLGLEISLGNI